MLTDDESPANDQSTNESRGPSPFILTSSIGRLFSGPNEMAVEIDPIAMIREARKFHRDCVHADRDGDATMTAESISRLIDACARRIDPDACDDDDGTDTP